MPSRNQHTVVTAASEQDMEQAAPWIRLTGAIIDRKTAQIKQQCAELGCDERNILLWRDQEFRGIMADLAVTRSETASKNIIRMLKDPAWNQTSLREQCILSPIPAQTPKKYRGYNNFYSELNDAEMAGMIQEIDGVTWQQQSELLESAPGIRKFNRIPLSLVVVRELGYQTQRNPERELKKKEALDAWFNKIAPLLDGDQCDSLGNTMAHYATIGILHTTGYSGNPKKSLQQIMDAIGPERLNWADFTRKNRAGISAFDRIRNVNQVALELIHTREYASKAPAIVAQTVYRKMQELEDWMDRQIREYTHDNPDAERKAAQRKIHPLTHSTDARSPPTARAWFGMLRDEAELHRTDLGALRLLTAAIKDRQPSVYSTALNQCKDLGMELRDIRVAERKYRTAGEIKGSQTLLAHFLGETETGSIKCATETLRRKPWSEDEINGMMMLSFEGREDTSPESGYHRIPVPFQISLHQSQTVRIPALKRRTILAKQQPLKNPTTPGDLSRRMCAQVSDMALRLDGKDSRGGNVAHTLMDNIDRGDGNSLTGLPAQATQWILDHADPALFLEANEKGDDPIQIIRRKRKGTRHGRLLKVHQEQLDQAEQMAYSAAMAATVKRTETNVTQADAIPGASTQRAAGSLRNPGAGFHKGTK